MSLLSDGMSGTGTQMIQFLLTYADEIPPEEFPGLLRYAYQRAYQGLDQYSTEELLGLFNRPRVREMLCGGEGWAMLHAQPDPVTIFRGFHSAESRHRPSWTLSRSQAAKFALLWHEKAGGAPKIIEARVDKRDVLACFPEEGELVLNPSTVSIVTECPVSDEERWVHGYGPRS